MDLKFDKFEYDKKQGAKNYDTKLAINGTFEDVIKVSITPMPAKKEKKK